MSAYYNEIDPFAAAWLRELIKRGLIAPGDVDERDIRDVQPADLEPYTQCHFFAGIGGWSYALRLAGWPDDRPVWTGSCPCQPWSIANVWQGGGKGTKDARHLAPCFLSLITERKPHTIFGEQVVGALNKGWLDELSVALENQKYAIGACVLRAGTFGADHERRRLFWVADSGRPRRERYKPLQRFSKPAQASFAISRDGFLRARRVMAHDYESVLPCDGLSVVLERSALRCYGNAIVPQVAQAFIESYIDVCA